MGYNTMNLLTSKIHRDTDFLDILKNASEVDKFSTYLLDIIEILVFIVIACAFLTALAYLIRFIKSKKDPYYEKDEDDFLDL